MNEWSLYACPNFLNGTWEQLEALVTYIWGTDIGEKILKFYSQSTHKTPIEALIDLGSDSFFKCPSRAAARAFAYNNVKSYLYSFNHIPSFSPSCYKAAHTFELEFVWPGFLGVPLTAEEKTFSDSLVSLWANIGNGNQLLRWPRYLASTDQNFILDLKTAIQSNYRKIQCDFWDTLS